MTSLGGNKSICSKLEEETIAGDSNCIARTVYLDLVEPVSLTNSNDAVCVSMPQRQFETEYFNDLVVRGFTLALRGCS